MQFIDNSDKIKSLLEEALATGLKNAADILLTDVKARSSGKTRGNWKATVDGDTATISSDSKDNFVEEFGQGEFAVAPEHRTDKKAKVVHPTRPLETAAITKRHVIEKAIADELKNLG